MTNRSAMLNAVFLGADERPAVVPPAFQCRDIEDPAFTPEVGQVFCIGDGLTPEQEPQTIFVPDDATRVFFGLVDRNSTVSPAPGWFGDDTGRFDVSIEFGP